MTSCIALDDFLRALARTPRRYAGKSQWVEVGPSTRESDGFPDRVDEASPERGPETLRGDAAPDHQPQVKHIPTGALRVRAASQVEEEHQAVNKRIPPGKETRNSVRDCQALPFQIRKGVVRKRRVPINELVLVNSTDYELIQRVHLYLASQVQSANIQLKEPVDSNTAYDLVDDPICGSEELSISRCPHNPRKLLSTLSRNIAKSQPEPLPCIDLSEFRMPITPAKKICRARRRGSGFDGTTKTRLMSGSKVRKKQSERGKVAMGELNLVTSGELCVWQADQGPQPIPPFRQERQFRLYGIDNACRPLASADANVDPVMPNPSPLKKPQRRVSFARDPRKSPPTTSRKLSEKGALESNGKRDILGGIGPSLPPLITEGRRTLGREIHEQFARVTAPARERESEFGDTESSSEGGSPDDEGYIHNDEVGNGPESSGEGDEEEEGKEADEDEEEDDDEEEDEEEEAMLLTTNPSTGPAVTGIKSIPISSFSLGDPYSQDGKPVGISLDSSLGPSKPLISESWKVTRPIHRNTLIEVEDEILNDTPEPEDDRLLEASYIRKRKRIPSLPLLPFRQREEEASASNLGSHNCAARLHQYAHGGPPEVLGKEAQAPQKLPAATGGKPLKPILRSRFPSNPNSFYIRCLNKPW